MEFYNPCLRNTEFNHSTIPLVTKCDRFIEKVSSEIKILLVDVLDSRQKAKVDVIALKLLDCIQSSLRGMIS